MFAALALAIGDLFRPPILRILLKSLAITLALFAALAVAGWYGLSSLIGPVLEDYGAGGELADLLAIGGTLALLWALWAVIAFAVIQFFGDEIVDAVEARHYPAAHALARPLGLREEAVVGLRSGFHARSVNLIALPVALIFLVTGIGTVVVFWLANSVVLGPQLVEMVRLRHRGSMASPIAVSRVERLALGGTAAALLLVPFINLLSPVICAALATHLFHLKQRQAHAA